MSAPRRGAAWQQEARRDGFIDDRRKLIPLFDVQEDLVRRLMTRGGRAVGRFCDLGAGDGGFAELVMDALPGVDRRAGRLLRADARRGAAALAGKDGRWEIVRGDLSDPGVARRVCRRASATTRSCRGFCIHHLPDERKRELYGEAFDAARARAASS